MHRAPPFGVGPYGIPVPVGGGGVQQDMANQQAMAQQALAQQAALAAAYQAQLQAPGYFAASMAPAPPPGSPPLQWEYGGPPMSPEAHAHAYAQIHAQAQVNV